jgi:hypothetical protein
MQAVIELNNLSISVDIISNGFTDQLIKKMPNVKGWDIIPKTWPCADNNWNQKEVDTHWQALRSAYYKLLSEINELDTVQLPETYDITSYNYYTNILHRIFTNMFQHKTFYGKRVLINDNILSLINEINDQCHMLEPYIINPTIQAWGNQKINCLELQCSNLDKTTIIDCVPYRDLVTWNADVYAIKHITGKDFLFSYFNEDTSNSWDISNCHVSYCGVCIDYNDDLKNFWKDPRFQEWLLKDNYTDKIGFVPIGTLSTDQKKLIKTLVSSDDFTNSHINITLQETA